MNFNNFNRMIIRLLICSNKYDFFGCIKMDAKKRLPKETLFGESNLLL